MITRFHEFKSHVASAAACILVHYFAKIPNVYANRRQNVEVDVSFSLTLPLQMSRQHCSTQLDGRKDTNVLRVALKFKGCTCRRHHHSFYIYFLFQNPIAISPPEPRISCLSRHAQKISALGSRELRIILKASVFQSNAELNYNCKEPKSYRLFGKLLHKDKAQV